MPVHAVAQLFLQLAELLRHLLFVLDERLRTLRIDCAGARTARASAQRFVQLRLDSALLLCKARGALRQLGKIRIESGTGWAIELPGRFAQALAGLLGGPRLLFRRIR